MARPGRRERNRTARSFPQLRRFHHVINSDKGFGTHNALNVTSEEDVMLFARLEFDAPPAKLSRYLFLILCVSAASNEARRLSSLLRSCRKTQIDHKAVQYRDAMPALPSRPVGLGDVAPSSQAE